MTHKPRQSFTEIELPAEPASVWRALTEAEELRRWFPLDAAVTPGQGGLVLWSWDGGWENPSRIEIWEPNRRLRLESEQPAPYDLDGKSHLPTSAGPVLIAIDFELEAASGGGTRLRVVHSGFGPGAEWDEEVDAVSRGWTVELRGLRHYLAHHRGKDRRLAWLHPIYEVSPFDAWARLVGPALFGAAEGLDALAEGGPYAIRAATGDPFSGTVVLWKPPLDFLATVDQMDASLLRFGIERGTGGRTAIQVILSTWGLPAAVAHRFEAHMQVALDAAFRGNRTTSVGRA